mmetsp:Transcript_92320/g.154916  ORF Transcript_92320/g.154916 Transcript_92320/m.154916 type:complete len:211 (-) Transcript_92320:63-695(-)
MAMGLGEEDQGLLQCERKPLPEFSGRTHARTSSPDGDVAGLGQRRLCRIWGEGCCTAAPGSASSFPCVAPCIFRCCPVDHKTRAVLLSALHVVLASGKVQSRCLFGEWRGCKWGWSGDLCRRCVSCLPLTHIVRLFFPAKRLVCGLMPHRTDMRSPRERAPRGKRQLPSQRPPCFSRPVLSRCKFVGRWVELPHPEFVGRRTSRLGSIPK